MNIRCHLVAAIMLFSLQGCILDMIFGGEKKKDDGTIRPIGGENAAIVPTDLTSGFEKTKDPKINADTWYAAGQLHEAQSNLPLAIEQYRKAVKENDEHHGALYRLGVLYATTRNYEQAIATWKRYIQVTHHSAVGYSNLGFSFELSGDTKEAERAYRTGIERDSDSAPCRVNYGLMLARHGRIDDGVAQMRPVLSEAEIHYNLGSIHEGQGRSALARVEYEKAVQLDPTLKDASIRLRKMDAVTGINPNE